MLLISLDLCNFQVKDTLIGKTLDATTKSGENSLEATPKLVNRDLDNEATPKLVNRDLDNKKEDLELEKCSIRYF
jgi:hypothetical protein